MKKAQRVAYQEDEYLERLVSSGKRVKVYLSNGVGLDGKVLGVGASSILLSTKEDYLKRRGVSQMVYKHAITSISETHELQEDYGYGNE